MSKIPDSPDNDDSCESSAMVTDTKNHQRPIIVRCPDLHIDADKAEHALVESPRVALYTHTQDIVEVVRKRGKHPFLRVVKIPRMQELLSVASQWAVQNGDDIKAVRAPRDIASILLDRPDHRFLALFGSKPRTSVQIVKRAQTDHELQAALDSLVDPNPVTTRYVGRALARFQGRLVGGCSIRVTGNSRGVNRWRLVGADERGHDVESVRDVGERARA